MDVTLTAEDRLQIQDTVARYAWALDTGDVESFVTCFCRDGTLTWDAFDTPDVWQGPTQLRQFASFLRDQPATAGRQHHVSNLRIFAEGGVIRACSYVAVALRSGEGPHLLTVMGYYEDVFDREGDAWRLKSRVIRDWSGPILHRIAGQTGERVARARPPALAALTEDRAK